MATLHASSMATARRGSLDDADHTALKLSRLLSRMEQTLLTSDSTAHIRNLQKSEYERNKANANVEYARTLLFRLEHDRNPSTASQESRNIRRQDIQDKRTLLKKIQNRLDELSHSSAEASDSDGDDGDSETERFLSRYAPALPNVSNSLETRVADPAALSPSQAQTAAAAATLTTTLRSRQKAIDSPATDRGVTSSSAAATGAPAATLGNITPFSPAPSRKAAEGDASKLLEAHDSEQTALTDSLLTLASALKSSTLSFSESLEGSNPILDQAVQALNKNVSGMEAAGKRMGVLRRMTEGKSWWARLSLWAQIGVLWVLLILIMFVMPKLRF